MTLVEEKIHKDIYADDWEIQIKNILALDYDTAKKNES